MLFQLGDKSTECGDDRRLIVVDGLLILVNQNKKSDTQVRVSLFLKHRKNYLQPLLTNFFVNTFSKE